MSESDPGPAQTPPPPTDTTRDPVLAGQTERGTAVAPAQWAVGKLGWLGRLTRRQARFLLIMLGASWGVIFESFRAHSWRRTVRYEFISTMNNIIRGGLIATMFAGVLTGVAAVSQVIYWLGLTGLATMTGSILINVVVREIAPILVGMLLLGRNGMLSTTELGLLSIGGEIRSMQAVGIDPFLLLVLPRTLAFTVAGFTLGILFSFASLVTGYVMSRLSGVINNPVWVFLDDVATAMSGTDYIIIPLKFITVGFVVGLGGCITGLTATNEDSLRTLLPRGFSRGMLIVMVVSVLFSLDI
ncbi:MlaE family ABC transporter permease [Acetobacter syzygii]|uniref:ABC transporter permease n=1 Tax=Acetobacter syzygii TaxID=146476 RepID=A0A270BSZ6_9PROT|nr:ABC transporter permease [Acetobacter syzygii]NSL92138.1 ABC transporter permease [Acetobacter syzygii]PAL28145.1 ABC transporter permease [Acetobacter syzygii]PAL28577.1 ABC transporter permease [Acetobacter syzygii]GAN70221.1 ABC transporter [Acetobacter syzygii]GBR63064.1 ABC transporter permease [Acetobacter syzygii NRIC 0483]